MIGLTPEQEHMAMMQDSPSYRVDAAVFYQRMRDLEPQAAPPEALPPMAMLAAQGAFRCAENLLGLLQECDEAFSKQEVDAALVKAFGHDGASVFRERVRNALVSPQRLVEE